MDTTQDNMVNVPAKRPRGRPRKLDGAPNAKPKQNPAKTKSAKKRGRPKIPRTKRSKYGNILGRPRIYRPEFCERTRNILAKGHNLAHLAVVFGVTDTTISEWQAKYPEFQQAVKLGKMQADDEIQRSLFRRAKGYTHKDEYISQYRGEIVRAETVKHYPPETAAMQFWLKNRAPAQWQDRVQVESEGISGFLAALGGHALASGPANSTDRKAIECHVVDCQQPGEQEPAERADDTCADGS